MCTVCAVVVQGSMTGWSARLAPKTEQKRNHNAVHALVYSTGCQMFVYCLLFTRLQQHGVAACTAQGTGWCAPLPPCPLSCCRTDQVTLGIYCLEAHLKAAQQKHIHDEVNNFDFAKHCLCLGLERLRASS